MKLKNIFALVGMLGVAVILTACTKPLTPEELAQKAKTCRENGLVPVEVHQGYSPTAVGVACHLPKAKDASH